jgi:hypothetical protein
MKTIALLALLALGVLTVNGCFWHHRRDNYSSGHYSNN